MLRAAGLLTQIGVHMVICIGIGFFFGLWLDNRLGTSPWLLIVGILLGVGAAFVGLYRITSEFWKK